MADKEFPIPEGLPAGWFVDHKVRRDGSLERFYHNIQTGQKIKTKEEMARYANYVTKTLPLVEAFRQAYSDGNGMLSDRPWENDPDHTIEDYIFGRVGKLKDRVASASNSDVGSVVDPGCGFLVLNRDDHLKVEEKPPSKGKGKGKGKGKKKAKR